jgi:hypothetical protein
VDPLICFSQLSKALQKQLVLESIVYHKIVAKICRCRRLGHHRRSLFGAPVLATGPLDQIEPSIELLHLAHSAVAHAARAISEVHKKEHGFLKLVGGFIAFFVIAISSTFLKNNAFCRPG